jgi:hypothetical protein
MPPKTYRALSVFFFLSAAVISILNLKRTMNLGWRSAPFPLFALGFIMVAFARKSASAKQ